MIRINRTGSYGRLTAAIGNTAPTDRVPVGPLAWRLAVTALAAGMCVLMVLTGCSGNTKSNDKTLVMFIPSTTDIYIAQWAAGARSEAERRGYSVKLIENNFDQTEQDNQVQQELASADSPAGYVWWPSDNKAGIASLRRIAAKGVPVVQTNNKPLPETQQYVSAYAGVDDNLSGKVAGANIMAARDWLKGNGKLSTATGNLLLLSYEPGYQAGVDRIEGIKEGMAADPLNVVRTEYAGFSTDSAYAAMLQLYPALKQEGIDVIWVGEDRLAAGVVKALRESGRTPGRDIQVVSSTCKGSLDGEKSGDIFGSSIQPPLYEGELTASVLVRLIENGNKTAGDTYNAPADPDTVPTFDGTPAKFNFMPNPGFTGGHGSVQANTAQIDATRLWNKNMDQLCDY
jgi:ABC-type sugar transport system substrate-binding protein